MFKTKSTQVVEKELPVPARVLLTFDKLVDLPASGLIYLGDEVFHVTSYRQVAVSDSFEVVTQIEAVHTRCMK